MVYLLILSSLCEVGVQMFVFLINGYNKYMVFSLFLSNQDIQNVVI